MLPIRSKDRSSSYPRKSKVNLADPGELTGFLRKHGLKADKSLGQHFLCAPNVVQAIVNAAKPFSGCLEIGPGPGILTSFLSRQAQVMSAVEFDARMIPLLRDSAPNCSVIQGDALRVDLSAIMSELPEPRALVSNLPYYITHPLLEKFSTFRHQYSCAVLMMQKEVGEKIMAKPGQRERGSLSVFLQTQFEITKVTSVPPGSFIPPPKVDSIVLKLVPREGTLPINFEKVVRAGFSQARKTLENNLAATLRLEKSIIKQGISELGLKEGIRAFEVTEDEWFKLVEIAQLSWLTSKPNK